MFPLAGQLAGPNGQTFFRIFFFQIFFSIFFVGKAGPFSYFIYKTPFPGGLETYIYVL